jgi:hypothetical protein
VTVWSGIYAKFGTERKDLITEATAEEFRRWFAIKGMDISFMSDETLNGDFMGQREPFRQWEIRLAFIIDAEAYHGITVYREKEAWEAFVSQYTEESRGHNG